MNEQKVWVGLLNKGRKRLAGDFEKCKVKMTTLSGQVRETNQRVLMGVGARYGVDSDACQQVGGTRKSQRKKPVRKAAGSTTSKKTPTTLKAAPGTGTTTDASARAEALATKAAATPTSGASNGVSNGTAAHA